MGRYPDGQIHYIGIRCGLQTHGSHHRDYKSRWTEIIEKTLPPHRTVLQGASREEVGSKKFHFSRVTDVFLQSACDLGSEAGVIIYQLYISGKAITAGEVFDFSQEERRNFFAMDTKLLRL